MSLNPHQGFSAAMELTAAHIRSISGMPSYETMMVAADVRASDTVIPVVRGVHATVPMAIQAGQVIRVGAGGSVSFLPRYANQGWTCRYCKALRPSEEQNCDNCGGPRRDDRPVIIVTNPSEVQL